AFANSGIVTEIRLDDLSGYQQHGVLAGLRFQQEVERLAATYGGGQQTAPAQRTSDFVSGKASSNLPACSYLPGIVTSPLHEWLPRPISTRLQEAFRIFDRKMNGFLTSESLVAGVESRSSSPVRIPRDIVTWQHPQLKNLYPCGEGSGYAGGITSSAMDGIKAAEAVSAT
ncbi:MAG: FAD-binding protein, partial [Bacteroidales bacterium]|nr:FAD-binding protein [Bacteroidales bacterium]